jgi:hypothetical protein
MTVSPDIEMDTFRKALARYLADAKEQLAATDELEPVVLLGGGKTFIQVDISPMPQALIQTILRNLCTAHPDVEYAVHISMAYTLAVMDEAAVKWEQIPGHKDARLQLVVHGSHRDLGFVAAHVPFTRKAEKQFEFGEIEWPEPSRVRDQLLHELWGKRRLNS